MRTKGISVLVVCTAALSFSLSLSLDVDADWSARRPITVGLTPSTRSRRPSSTGSPRWNSTGPDWNSPRAPRSRSLEQQQQKKTDKLKGGVSWSVFLFQSPTWNDSIFQERFERCWRKRYRLKTGPHFYDWTEEPIKKSSAVNTLAVTTPVERRRDAHFRRRGTRTAISRHVRFQQKKKKKKKKKESNQLTKGPGTYRPVLWSISQNWIALT